jgi:hypothetical protein
MFGSFDDEATIGIEVTEGGVIDNSSRPTMRF